MFKSKSKNQMAKQSDTSSPDKLNRIVEGTKMEGTFRSESNIRITPDVMVGGSGGNGMTDALMGTILKDMIGEKKK